MTEAENRIFLEPIGVVRSPMKSPDGSPKHFSVSDVEGVIEVFPSFAQGLYRLEERKQISVIFHFHLCDKDYDLLQTTLSSDDLKGVFSTCSRRRPNGLGLSILDVLGVEENRIYVRGLDMVDGTPVYDIKPFKPF